MNDIMKDLEYYGLSIDISTQSSHPMHGILRTSSFCTALHARAIQGMACLTTKAEIPHKTLTHSVRL